MITLVSKEKTPPCSVVVPRELLRCSKVIGEEEEDDADLTLNFPKCSYASLLILVDLLTRATEALKSDVTLKTFNDLVPEDILGRLPSYASFNLVPSDDTVHEYTKKVMLGTTWYAEFFYKLNFQELIEILGALEYLDIPVLIKLTTLKVAAYIKDRSEEDLRRMQENQQKKKKTGE